jgi:hypothetical protein
MTRSLAAGAVVGAARSPSGVRGQLYLVYLPLAPTLVAELNVGLMAETVSTPARADRLLTLHCRHTAPRSEGSARVDHDRSGAKSDRRLKVPDLPLEHAPHFLARAFAEPD